MKIKKGLFVLLLAFLGCSTKNELGSVAPATVATPVSSKSASDTLVVSAPAVIVLGEDTLIVPFLTETDTINMLIGP